MAILVTGANGQIGTVLTNRLRLIHGEASVIASDIVPPAEPDPAFVMLDILNEQRIAEVIVDYKITEIYHLAAILSASGEWNPTKTWNVNLNGLLSILELARIHQLERVFFPSTIAVFGNTTPRVLTGQHVPQLPETVYGMSKAAGEFWCNYYYHKYDLDVRSLRYPGIIGYDSAPGGGTTDYAVEIFHEALKGHNYTCYLAADTRLPMMYMDDAIRATIELMSAPQENIKIRSSYNVAGCSFTPDEVAQEIKNHLPTFSIDYLPDFRQKIAASWCESIDDQEARSDWGWQPKFDLPSIAKTMIQELAKEYV